MAGTRALFASIGAGVALVAAAALTLLALSALFAFGGWNDSISKSAKEPALVFAGSTLPKPEAPTARAAAEAPRIVAPTPVPRVQFRDDARAATVESTAVATDEPPMTSVAAKVKPAPDLNEPAEAAAPDTATRPAAPAARKTGDHVRKAGESLSSAVQKTGTALASAAQPLAPPVSAAVQQMLNLVAAVVRRAADGLGNALDALLPKNQP